MKNGSLDLLLVHPSFTNVYQDAQEAIEYPAIEPPYLAALTADFIRRRGYTTDIIDANVEGFSPQKTAEVASQYNPKLVHVVVHGNQPSASSQLMNWVQDFSSNLKNINYETKILLTGTHPSALPERTLLDMAGDYVGRGDGVFTALGLLENKPLEQIPGIWYRNDGKIEKGPIDKLVEANEMSEVFPRAAWDLLPIEKYRAHDWHCLDNLEQRSPYAAMYTSFGCPFACTFCCINAPFNEGGERKSKIRCRDPTQVVDEIEWLVNKHGVDKNRKLNLKIIDEMFVLDQRHYTTIAKEIINRNLGESLNIWAYSRVDTVKEGHLDLLKKAGFNWLALGIESGSDYVRDGIEKGRFGETEMYKVVKSIKDAGIYIVGNYIFGLPDDTHDTMRATYNLALELNCERPNFYSAMAYPGSELHRMAQRKMYPVPETWDKDRPLLPEDKNGPGWIGYSQHSYQTLNLPTTTLLPEEVLAYRDDSLVRYFSEPKYLNMLKSKFGEETAEKFCKMNAIRPKRKLLGHANN